MKRDLPKMQPFWINYRNVLRKQNSTCTWDRPRGEIEVVSLRDSGILSEEEFQQAKQNFLVDDEGGR
jgi:hypothetical protein